MFGKKYSTTAILYEKKGNNKAIINENTAVPVADNPARSDVINKNSKLLAKIA